MWNTHTIPYVLFATFGTFVVKICKNVITFTMSVRLSVLRTSIRTFIKFDAEQCLLNSIGGFQFWSKSNTSDGHLMWTKVYTCVTTHISIANPYIFIGTRSVSKQTSTESEIRIFSSVHFFFVRLKGLRHKQKGVQATEPFCYACVSKLVYSTVSG
jgi:hypothetical protein